MLFSGDLGWAIHAMNRTSANRLFLSLIVMNRAKPLLIPMSSRGIFTSLLVKGCGSNDMWDFVCQLHLPKFKHVPTSASPDSSVSFCSFHLTCRIPVQNGKSNLSNLDNGAALPWLKGTRAWFVQRKKKTQKRIWSRRSRNRTNSSTVYVWEFEVIYVVCRSLQFEPPTRNMRRKSKGWRTGVTQVALQLLLVLSISFFSEGFKRWSVFILDSIVMRAFSSLSSPHLNQGWWRNCWGSSAACSLHIASRLFVFYILLLMCTRILKPLGKLLGADSVFFLEL